MSARVKDTIATTLIVMTGRTISAALSASACSHVIEGHSGAALTQQVATDKFTTFEESSRFSKSTICDCVARSKNFNKISRVANLVFVIH